MGMVKRVIKQKGVTIRNTNDYGLQSLHDIKLKSSFVHFVQLEATLRDGQPEVELYRLKFDFKTLWSFCNIKELKRHKTHH